MAKKDGKPCKKCGTSDWYDNGRCRQCNRTRVKKWQRDNPDKYREKGRRWYDENARRECDRKKRWRENYPDTRRERLQRWRENNPEKTAIHHNRRRARLTGAGGSYTAAEWQALCKQYGGRCACCGQKKKLTADHVIPVIAGGSSDISNIQPLCRPCNSSKGTKTTDYRTKPGIKRWIQNKLFD